MSNSVLRRAGPLGRGLAAALAAACSGLLVAACGGSGPPAGQAAAGQPATSAAPRAAAAAAVRPAVPGAGTAPVMRGTQPPSASGLPRCRTGQLSSAFTGLNAASGGGQGMTLILTNYSRHSCYLYGYVGLGLLGGHLTFPGPLPTHVTWVSAPHRLVRLHPGGNAQALLTWNRSTLAGGRLEYPQRVEITPPDAYQHLTGMWPKTPVNSGKIAVWPLRPAPAGPVPTGTGTVRNPFNGMCVTAAGNGSTDGTEVVASKCGRDASQQWTAYSDGTLRINGKCLDVTGYSTATGATVDLWACGASPSQQWLISQVSLNPFGSIGNPASGNVLTDPGGSTVNGTQLLMGPDRGDQSGPWQVSFYHYLGH
jgi:Ricin-type beta-trefoil lectin domain/Domain of unknown function (DUF4232)